MITIFLSCILNVYALDNLHFNLLGNKYAAGIEAHLGVSGLRMTETVYQDSSDNGLSSDRLLSEIDWDMGAQMTAGTGLNVTPVNPFAKIGFSFEGNFWWYFPANDRTMKDTDWDDNGKKYGYGESIASALTGMEAEGRLAAIFPIRNKCLIEAAAEVWYGRYAAVAHDGWTSWADSGEKIPLYGAAIEYIQEWIMFAPGVGFGLKLNNARIGVRAAVSPFIWGYHIDNHYFRTLENDDPEQKYISYTDKTNGGIFYRIQGDCRWDITRYVQVGIAVNYRAVINSRGDTTMSTTGLAGYSFVEDGTAGAAIQTFGCDLTIRTAL
jgi:outer membrane protease